MQEKDKNKLDLGDDDSLLANSDPDNFLDEVSSDMTSEDVSSPEPKIEVPQSSQQPHSRLKRLVAALKDIWHNPKKRWTAIGIMTAILVGLLVVPNSRYFVMNSVGIRSSASVTVLDSSTSQPLKNVNVTLAGVEAITNDDGVAKLEKIKLGTTTLVVQKRAFASTEKQVTVGWGSNPLGDHSLNPVGIQYKFSVRDFLSDQPIDKAEVASGEFSAFSNQDGEAVLTIDAIESDKLEVVVKAKSYRDEALSQDADAKDAQAVKLVAARKHLFVSKRSGKFDVYKIDIDGKNEQLVLSGTGNERDDIALVPHPEKDVTALVSSRDTVRNKDGFLLSTLTLIETNGAEVTTDAIARSEQIQVIGWSGDQLVYVQIAEGASAANPKRHRLITYNYSNGQSKELAASNYFNDVLLVGSDIYYSSSSYQGATVGMIKVSAKGENQKTVFDQEVWNIFRTDYDTIMFSVQNNWYEYSLKDNKVLAASGPPAAQQTRIYIDGPDKKQSLWIDQRDGKGTLLAFNVESNEDKVIKAQSGLVYPTTWVNADTAVYRVANNQETADYVVSLKGGDARKIVNVTNTGGVDRWYYY